MAKPIYKGNGIYQLTADFKSDRRGTRIRKRMNYHVIETAPSKIEKELIRAQADFEKKCREEINDRYAESKKLTYEDYMRNQWLPWALATNQIKQNTYEGYLANAEKYIFPVLGNKPIGIINSRMIEMIYDGMLKKGLSPTTCKRVHEIISSSFTRACKTDLVNINPCKNVYLPKKDDEYHFKVFSEDQATRFIKALSEDLVTVCPERTRKNKNGEVYTIAAYQSHYFVSTMFQAYFTLALGSAMRRGEECALTWGDVDLDKKTVQITKAITKTRKDGEVIKAPKTAAGYRIISIPDSCVNILRKWKLEYLSIMEEEGENWKGRNLNDFNANYVFIQTQGDNVGEHLSVDTVTGKFRQIIKAYNNQFEEGSEMRLPYIRLHDLRHTSASIMLANGADIVTVSKRLGHEKPSTTLDIYSHLIPGKDKQASDIFNTIF